MPAQRRVAVIFLVKLWIWITNAVGRPAEAK
jgi:hypothetical protein